MLELGGAPPGASQTLMSHALTLMESALGLLDAADAPHDVGAHLDLAVHRLKEAVERSWSDDPGAR